MSGSLDVNRSTLLLIDLQNDYCHPDGALARGGLRVPDQGRLVGAVNQLSAAARRAGRPVVWVRMVFDSDGDLGLLGTRAPLLVGGTLRRGTWGAEILDGLDVAESDHVVDKRRFSAFFGTDLEALLLRLGTGRLVVGGVRTDFCVESTVRDAFFRDLQVSLVDEAVAGYVEDMHRSSLRVMSAIFADVVPLDRAVAELAEELPEPAVRATT